MLSVFDKPGGVKRHAMSMPGSDPNVFNVSAKRRNMLDHLPGRVNPDTPQNAVSTTAIMLPPPKAIDQTCPRENLYAPHSMSELADVPTRGDWAVYAEGTTREAKNWLAMHISSGLNPYGNAIPVFTNMAGVPRSVKIRFAGMVGNAGNNKHLNNGDHWGQVYSAGALSGRNSGPDYIPPLSHVYISPYPYILKENDGRERPGYKDPGWEGIDKYLPAVHALRDKDVFNYFHWMEERVREVVDKGNAAQKSNEMIRDLGIHPHLPLAPYARQFLFHANAEAAFKEYLQAEANQAQNIDAVRRKAVKAMNDLCMANKNYWAQLQKEQKDITDAMGSPAWGNRLNSLQIAPLPDNPSSAEMMLTWMQLSHVTHQVFKLQFAEQNNFIRSQVFGKSRYGSPSTGILDVMVGYRV